MRGTILQPWNWYTPKVEGGKKLWQRLERDAKAIKDAGYTAVWLPPASKGAGGEDDVGYGICNWYGFDNTKYGSLKQLQDAGKALAMNGVGVYHDQVFNHLMGGQEEDQAWCLSVKKNNKNERVSDDCVWFKGKTYTKFPDLGLTHDHFDAYLPNDYGCWVLTNKLYQCGVDDEYLCGCDLDYDNIDLVMKLHEFGRWYKSEVNVDGYRFDAVKHVRPQGTLEFLREMRRSNGGMPLFAVGEFLEPDCGQLLNYIARTNGELSLFDVPLQRKLVQASQQGNSFDMGGLLQGTLVGQRPTLAVTFVHSHDDQPPMHGGGGRGCYVGDWFVSQAYALILLRDEGYPSVSDVDTLNHGDMIRRYMALRQDCTYGYRTDRFDHLNTVGWSFTGGQGYDNSMAVVLTNGDYGKKWLPTGKPRAPYRDFTGALGHVITTNNDGWAEFECPPGGSAAWVEESKFNALNGKMG